MRSLLWLSLGAALLWFGLAWGEQAQARRASRAGEGWRHPYGGARFLTLLEDSYTEGEPTAFLGWMDQGQAELEPLVPGRPAARLVHALDAERGRLGGMADPQERRVEQIRVLQWSHRFVKRLLPSFSLDRGFEFRAAATAGERQCHLQSVLIASMLQRAGIEAGVALVYRNVHGRDTNNGHVVVVARLAGGTDRIVDASEATPFARQQGLLMEVGGYRYVAPVYREGPDIHGYRLARSGRVLPVRAVAPLDFALVRSQFFYYRGERAPGGLLVGPRTPEGLAGMEPGLERSLEICPRNPLPRFLLGRVREEQGRTGEARDLLAQARGEYERCGWVPPNVEQALDRVGRTARR